MRKSALTHAIVAPIRDQPNESLDRLTGSLFVYDYDRLKLRCDPESLARYVQKTRKLFAPVAREFDDKKNTEWLLRSYLALKLILHATVMATSAEYGRDRNLRMVVPYLIYYTLFNACRAFLLTCPDVVWKGAATAQMSHAGAITEAVNVLRRLDGRIAEEASKRFWAAKSQRELFSYGFPMSGTEDVGTKLISLEEAIGWAGLFAELAHLNSACLEGSVAKFQKGKSFDLLEDEAFELMSHALPDGEEHFDMEDWAWLGRLYRDHTAPVALTALVTEGMTEDFFGTWANPDDEDAYDPDQNWRILLDVW